MTPVRMSVLSLFVLAGLHGTATVARAAEATPQATPCPEGLPAGTTCKGGKDSAGAFYLIAIPKDWKGDLVLHAHGGPALGAPKADRVVEDLKRWSIMVKAGYAWAGSSFAQGGVAVRAAATDTERLRKLFIEHVGKPRRTILHGQSWGAGVAAKAAEMFTEGKPYDAVLLSSGVLAGGSRSYDFRLDLRVVYQHLCRNHPRPDEPQYPVWMGLPADSKMTPGELADRAKECLGVGIPAAQRTPEQAARMKTIVDVIRIPDASVRGHLNWATFHFRDISKERSGGKPVFGNIGARYSGSADDEGLNAAVARYAADPEAVAKFADDTDPNGRIPVPVLTVHAVGDPTAFVEMEHTFRQTMEKAGTDGHLVQTFTDDREHSYLSDPVYPTLVEALLDWVSRGKKPTPQGIADRCELMKPAFGDGCRFLPVYQPASLDSRVAPRQRP